MQQQPLQQPAAPPLEGPGVALMLRPLPLTGTLAAPTAGAAALLSALAAVSLAAGHRDIPFFVPITLVRAAIASLAAASACASSASSQGSTAQHAHALLSLRK